MLHNVLHQNKLREFQTNYTGNASHLALVNVSAGGEIDPLIVLFNEFIFMKTIGTKGNNSDMRQVWKIEIRL